MSRIKEGMLCIISVKSDLPEIRGKLCTTIDYAGTYKGKYIHTVNAWRCQLLGA